MSPIGWHFAEALPDQKVREPIQGEFFATEAISNPGEALVREGIQNSLDAHQAWPVRVRIFLSGAGEHALSAAKMGPFVRGLWPHVTAEGNGLRDLPAQEEPCSYLVFEDFNTCGLEGDPGAHFHEANTANHFFNFFRAEGHTNKSGEDRGRWGLGKHVFPRSSRIQTIYALTVRASDRRKLAMGLSVMKSHRVGDKCYTPDGWLGVQPADTQQVVLPMEQPLWLNIFSDSFRLERRDEPGLSIVVPWYDTNRSLEDGRDTFTEVDLLHAVLRGYYWPILEGKLEVTLETPASRRELRRSTLLAEVAALPPELRKSLQPQIALAEWALSLPPREIFSLNPVPASRGWAWTDALWHPETAKLLKNLYYQGEQVALRVPVTVRELSRGIRSEKTYFEVFFVRDDSKYSRPEFIRDGLIIPDVGGTRVPGTRALVVARDRVISRFLGDAENPAHTEWQHGGDNFKKKYKSGRTDLEFVKKSVSAIVRHLMSLDQEQDKVLLGDYFPAPPLEPEPAMPALGRGDNGKAAGAQTVPAEELEVAPDRKKTLRISKIKGGFSVHASQWQDRLPALMRIEVAYQVRRGDAFKKYHTADFELDKSPIELKQNNFEPISTYRNLLIGRITDSAFRLTVTGFDDNRDLRLKLAPVETGDVD